MKIKIVIKNIIFFNDNSKIYLGISLELLRQCGASSVSDSSLFQLIILKVYRPLPMLSQC